MSPQAYIEERLRALSKPAPAAADDLVERIYKIVLSKKFRKYAAPPENQSRIRKTIEDRVAQHLPIRFLWPFGGYKLWRLEEAPLPDWAELFACMYLARWLKPIADTYKPGVEFVFSTDEMIVERINNIPKSDTEAYEREFLKLLDFMREYMPENFSFSLVPMRTHFKDRDFEAELAKQIELDTEKYGGLPTLKPEQIKTIDMNVRLTSGQADDPLWREKNALVHDAYIAITDPYLAEEGTIGAFSVPIGVSNFVAVGTTKTSIVRFWVGAGALLKREDSYIENVLSPTQLERAAFDWADLSIQGLEGRNFKRLRILQGQS